MTSAAFRIVTIAQNVPGPVAVARLVAGGATAVKVEPPAGDPLERLSASWYAELHAHIPVERLDLKSADGMAALRAHLAAADVFVASHRPAALARLGLDAAAVRDAFPTLRHLNIVGDTARPDEAGHDLTYQARLGLVRGGLPATLLADMIGAERAHAAILALMHEGPGGHRRVGLVDGLRDFAAPLRHGMTRAGGPLGGADAAYAVYDAREGAVAVAALEPHFRARLFEALGLPDGSNLAGVMRERTAAEWEAWASRLDIPLVAVADGDRG